MPIGNVSADARHYFCSRSGFTERLHKLADEHPDRVKLVTPEGLYEALR